MFLPQNQGNPLLHRQSTDESCVLLGDLFSNIVEITVDASGTGIVQMLCANQAEVLDRLDVGDHLRPAALVA